MYSGDQYIPEKLSERRMSKAKLLSNPFHFPPLNTWKAEHRKLHISRFRVFNIKKWNRSEIMPTYVARRLDTFLEIYWPAPYTKAFTSYKVTTKHVENGTLWLLTYISEMLSSTAEIDISFESSRNSGRHGLGCYPIRFIFHPKTRGKRNIENFIYPVSAFSTVKTGTDWIASKPMSLAVLRAFQGYTDLCCTWKRMRVIR